MDQLHQVPWLLRLSCEQRLTFLTFQPLISCFVVPPSSKYNSRWPRPCRNLQRLFSIDAQQGNVSLNIVYGIYTCQIILVYFFCWNTAHILLIFCQKLRLSYIFATLLLHVTIIYNCQNILYYMYYMYISGPYILSDFIPHHLKHFIYSSFPYISIFTFQNTFESGGNV